MTDLNAIVSDPEANAYLTLERAETLIGGYPSLVQDRWEDLDLDDQGQLLMEAARKIDTFAPWGPKKVEGQALAFPRANDTDIPLEVVFASMEYAAYMLDGKKRGLKESQEEGVTSISILGQTSNFDADPSGLPAGARRQLEVLVRKNWTSAVGNRKLNCPDQGSFFG